MSTAKKKPEPMKRGRKASGLRIAKLQGQLRSQLRKGRENGLIYVWHDGDVDERPVAKAMLMEEGGNILLILSNKGSGDLFS